MYHSPADQLNAGIKQLELNLDLPSQQKLLKFLEFLQKWNRHYNLTAITELDKMISYHLLDSLAVAPYIVGNLILDVGSGGGFPGIPLAILFPHKQWVLLDSNGKKTRFLTQAKTEFKLNNIEVVHHRVEDWQPLQQYDTIIARALGSVTHILQQTQHLLGEHGCWLLMKGALSAEELESVDFPMISHQLTVPGISGQRQVLIIRK